MSLASTACGQQLPDSFKLTSEDSSFISHVVTDMDPDHYIATKTHFGIVIVMVFRDYTLIETLVEDYVEDIAELTPKGIIVYPRESE